MGEPFKCSDGLCGQEDCLKCHPENFAYNEEGKPYYVEPEKWNTYCDNLSHKYDVAPDCDDE